METLHIDKVRNPLKNLDNPAIKGYINTRGQSTNIVSEIPTTRISIRILANKQSQAGIDLGFLSYCYTPSQINRD